MDHFNSHHVQRPHYFEGNVSGGFKRLLANRVITNIGTGLFSVFLPIFLYITLGKSLQYVALYYLSTYVFSLILVSTIPQSFNKFGFRKALQISTLIGALYYLAVFLLNADNFWFILPIMSFLLAFWRFLYWIPYNIDFAKFTSKKDRGKELGLMEAGISLVGIVTPLIAGLIISRFGFNPLFFIGIIIFILSLIPLIKIPATNESFSWDRKSFLKKAFDKKNRKLALFFTLDGAESRIAAFVWPIFVYELLQGNYLEIGIISTLVVTTTMILQLLAGKIVDKKEGKLIKAGGFFYATGWFLKIFAATAFHVFVFDAFHSFMKVFYRIPLDTLVFETAFNQKHLIDEFNVFRQFWLFVGSILMSLLVIVAASLTNSISLIFISGMIAVFFISIFYKKIQDSFLS